MKAQGASGALVNAMRDEEDAFVNYVVFQGSGKFPELFTADYVFASAFAIGVQGDALQIISNRRAR